MWKYKSSFSLIVVAIIRIPLSSAKQTDSTLIQHVYENMSLTRSMHKLSTDQYLKLSTSHTR